MLEKLSWKVGFLRKTTVTPKDEKKDLAKWASRRHKPWWGKFEIRA